MDLRPFVYAVPAELLAFSDLLSGAGVAQTARLVDVLNKVARPAAALLRYDTKCYINVRSKADISQLNLPHGTDN